MMLDVVLYMEWEAPDASRLLDIVAEVVSGTPGSWEVATSHSSLISCIRGPRWHPAIVILCPRGLEELRALVGIRRLIHPREVILVLPQQNRDMTALGHRLYPRYLTWMDQGMKDVAAVLGAKVRAACLADSEKAAPAREGSSVPVVGAELGQSVVKPKQRSTDTMRSKTVTRKRHSTPLLR